MSYWLVVDSLGWWVQLTNSRGLRHQANDVFAFVFQPPRNCAGDSMSLLLMLRMLQLHHGSISR